MFDSLSAPAANIPQDHGNDHFWPSSWPRPSSNRLVSLLHEQHAPSYDFFTPLYTSLTQLLDRQTVGDFNQPVVGTPTSHILPRSSSNTYNPDDMGLGGVINTHAVLLHEQKVHIGIMSVVAGTISVVSCLVALYWFVLMRRNFRRT